MPVINTRLKLLRKAHGFSKKEVALKCNTSRVALDSWENGNTYPPIPFAISLAELFSTSIDYIFCRTDRNIHISETKPNLRLELLDKDTCTNLDISYMLLKTWSNGGLPRMNRCVIIADYHNISLDYLLGLTPFSNWDLYDEENMYYPRLSGIPVKIINNENATEHDCYGLVSDDAKKIYLSNGESLPIEKIKFTELF